MPLYIRVPVIAGRLVSSHPGNSSQWDSSLQDSGSSANSPLAVEPLSIVRAEHRRAALPILPDWVSTGNEAGRSRVRGKHKNRMDRSQGRRNRD